MSVSASNNTAASATTQMANGGAREKDRAEAQNAPQFGEIMQNIQSRYGARPEKTREIKKTLGKDDFLRIMITQMRHQDPTNPFKAEQMAAEMAQFTSVEQLQNVNQTLTKMISGNQPLERMSMTNLIGKSVTVDRERFPHTEGKNDSLSYSLPSNAESVKIAIVNEQGETVLEQDLGKQNAGEGKFEWDGKKANTLPAKAGVYMLKVDARDEKGVLIRTNSQARTRVIGVSFEGAEPVFIVGDSQRQEKVTMKNIVRIETDASMAPEAPAPAQAGAPVQARAAAAPAAAAAAPALPSTNFIAYQKGVGSSNLDTAALTAEAQRAISAFQGEKGFPNGLHDPDSAPVESGTK